MALREVNSRYHQPQVEVSGSRTLRTAFELQNISKQTWSANDGFAVGYHIFDPDTDTLVIDGARTNLNGDLVPGNSDRIQLSFDLPAEPGRYRVFISPMRENVGWYYEHGWQFLLVDAIVENGQARIEDVRLATAASLKRQKLVRTVRRALTYPFLTLWRNRSLIRTMARRDIVGRYRGTFGGAFWTLLNPLLLMGTYFFVFGVVLQTRFGDDPSRSGFVLYFLAGMLPWLPFSEAVGRAPTVVLEHRNFVKKLVFPVETLPVNLVASGLVTQGFALLLFVIGLVLARGAIPASVGWLPLLLLPQILLTLGLCWFLAALGVFVRDLGPVMGFVLTLWFFLTPICYPEGQIPAVAVPILNKNPILVLVRGYRAIFLEGHAPSALPLGKLWLVSIAAFIGGHAWFYKLRKSFSDVI